MLGVMYALVAVGFTLFFGVLDVIHFSHGDIFMLGAFTGLTVLAGLRAAGVGGALLALPLTFAASILVTGAVGVLAERVCVKPLARASPLMTLLATLSLGLVIREAVLIFYPRGADPKPFPRLLRRGDRRARQRLRRDHRRPALRRPPDDGGGPHPPWLRVPGRRRVRRRHGVPRVQAERSPRREERRARVSRDLAGVWLTEAAVFALVVAGILAERPWALGATGGALVAAGGLVRFVPRLGAALAGAFARRRAAALAGGAVLALALPLALRSSPYWTFVATLALLYVTTGQGLNFQIGTAGVLNLAGAAFAGLGGYAVGLLTVAGGWPSWLALLAGPVVAVAVGAILFVPILKTRGHYLALVTIAFVFIFNILMNTLESP